MILIFDDLDSVDYIDESMVDYEKSLDKEWRESSLAQG
jgi:hypothetical protein